MTYVTIAGQAVLDIYECENARCWFITRKVQKAGQNFLSGYVRCFKPAMLAEFRNLPEEVFNDPKQSIWKVTKKAWPRCPCVDVKQEQAKQKVVGCDDAIASDSCSRN